METVTVSKFMEEQGITAEIKHAGAGKDLAPFHDGDWDCDAWKVTFKRAGKLCTFDYYTGAGHRKLMNPWDVKGVSPLSVYYEQTAILKAIPPKPEDVLDCLAIDASCIDQTFEDWCADFGYEEDSRKAEKTYNACRHNALRLLKFLGGRDVLEALMNTERR